VVFVSFVVESLLKFLISPYNCLTIEHTLVKLISVVGSKREERLEEPLRFVRYYLYKQFAYRILLWLVTIREIRCKKK